MMFIHRLDETSRFIRGIVTSQTSRYYNFPPLYLEVSQTGKRQTDNPANFQRSTFTIRTYVHKTDIYLCNTESGAYTRARMEEKEALS